MISSLKKRFFAETLFLNHLKRSLECKDPEFEQFRENYSKNAECERVAKEFAYDIYPSKNVRR